MEAAVHKEADIPVELQGAQECLAQGNFAKYNTKCSLHVEVAVRKDARKASTSRASRFCCNMAAFDHGGKSACNAGPGFFWVFFWFFLGIFFSFLGLDGRECITVTGMGLTSRLHRFFFG